MSKMKDAVTEIRQAECPKGNVVEFSSIANTADDAKQFGTYLKHLSRGGVLEYEIEVKGIRINYVARVDARRKGNVCHLIQTAARKHNAIVPVWLGNQAASYRAAKDLPKLNKRPRVPANPKQPAAPTLKERLEVEKKKLLKQAKLVAALEERNYKLHKKSPATSGARTNKPSLFTRVINWVFK